MEEEKSREKGKAEDYMEKEMRWRRTRDDEVVKIKIEMRW